MTSETDSLYPLSEYRFQNHNLRTGATEVYAPDEDNLVPRKYNNRREAESATELLYEVCFDCIVGNINQRRKDDRVEYVLRKLPPLVRDTLEDEIIRHSDLNSDEADKAIARITKDGVPDLLVCKNHDHSDFRFVEVKRDDEAIDSKQKSWASEFDYFPMNFVRVYPPAGESQTSTPTPDTDNLADLFKYYRHQYGLRPKNGTRKQNDGELSLATLVHYALLDVTGFDPGVIRSFNNDVAAAALASLRCEGVRDINQYTSLSEQALHDALEAEFAKQFGTESNPTPVEVTGSLGAVSAEICAVLDVLEYTDPVTAAKHHLD